MTSKLELPLQKKKKMLLERIFKMIPSQSVISNYEKVTFVREYVQWRFMTQNMIGCAERHWECAAIVGCTRQAAPQ